MNTRRIAAVLMFAAAAASALFAPAVCAADASATNAALFKLQSSVQRLTQENSELQSKLDAADAALAAARSTAPSATTGTAAPQTADLAQTKAAHDAQLAAASSRYEANIATLNAGIERAKAQTLEIAGKYRELAATLRNTEIERARAAATEQRHVQRALACEQQNEKLRQIGLEVLERYEHKGFWQVFAAAEPFTQVQRARLENEVDAYRMQIADLYADVGGPPTAVPNAPAGSPAGGVGASASPAGGPAAGASDDVSGDYGEAP